MLRLFAAYNFLLGGNFWNFLDFLGFKIFIALHFYLGFGPTQTFYK